MPTYDITTAEQDKLRAGGHKSIFYLTASKPATLLTAQVADSGIERGDTTIAFDGGTSSDTSRIVEGLSVEVITSVGTYSARVAGFSSSGSSPTITGTITVDANSIPWEDNAVLTIYEAYDPRVIPLTFDPSTGVSTKRGQVFSNQKLPPQVKAGSHRAAFPSGGSASFVLAGQARPMHPGATITGWLWECTGGTIASPTSQNTTLDISTPGQYWLSLTATDSNGQSKRTSRRVWVPSADPEDSTHPYTDVQVGRISLSAGGDVRVSVNVSGVADFETFVDGSLIAIWHRGFYGASEEHISRITGGENLLFSGYILKGTVVKNREHGSVSFELGSVISVMKQLPMQALSIHAEYSQDYWFQIDTQLTLERMIWWLIHWHSNIGEIVDIDLPETTLYKKLFKFNEGSLFSQIRSIAEKGACRVGCNKAGQIFIEPDIQLLDSADRAAETHMMEITTADLRDELRIVRRHRKDVAVTYVEGFHYDGGSQITPYCSIAPTKIREATGSGKRTADGMILADQDHANLLSGRIAATENNEYVEIRAAFAGNYSIIDVFPQRWWTISLAAGDTLRGLTETELRLVPRVVELEQAGDVVLVDAVFESEAFGPDGIFDPCPSCGDVDPDQTDKPAWQAEEALGALVAFSSINYRDDNAAGWDELDTEPVNHGVVDPYWKQKQKSLQPSKAIFWTAGDGEIAFYTEGARTLRTPATDPPDTWSDGPGPSVAGLAFGQVASDIFTRGKHYAFASWQNGASAWRGWLAITTDDWLTASWVEPYDGVTLPAALKPLGVAVNDSYILLTVWQDNTLKLLVFDLDGVYQATHALGAALLAEVADTYHAFPVAVVDDSDLWHVAGRMDAPAGLAGVQHIIKTTDAGSSWQSVEASWGADRCTQLAVAAEAGGSRLMHAVRLETDTGISQPVTLSSNPPLEMAAQKLTDSRTLTMHVENQSAPNFDRLVFSLINTSVDPPTVLDQSIVDLGSVDHRGVSLIYADDNGAVATWVYDDDLGNYQPKAALVDCTDDTLGLATVNLQSAGTTYIGWTDVALLTNSLAVAVWNTTATLYGCTLAVDLVARTVTANTDKIIENEGHEHPQVAKVNSTTAFVAFQSDDFGDDAQLAGVSLYNCAASFDVGTRVYFDALMINAFDAGANPHCAVPAGDGKVLVAYNAYDQNDPVSWDYYIFLCCVGVSGATSTPGNIEKASTIANGYDYAPSVTFDPALNDGLVVFNDDDNIRQTPFSISGTTTTAGTESELVAVGGVPHYLSIDGPAPRVLMWNEDASNEARLVVL
jgi:hypothetical protein